MARLKTWEEEFEEKYQKYVPEHVKALLEEAKRRSVASLAARPPGDFKLTWIAEERYAEHRTMPEYIANRIRENFMVPSSFSINYSATSVLAEGAWRIKAESSPEWDMNVRITHKLAMQLLAPPDDKE
jgi:hypothetical protein